MIQFHRVAGLCMAGLLTVASAAFAEVAPVESAIDSPPQIVPSLLLGRDTSAQAAAAKQDARFGTALGDAHDASGPMQAFGQLAASLGATLDAPVAQADRKSRVASGVEQLRAADLLVQAQFDRIDAQLRTLDAAGMAGALSRIATARATWLARSTPLIARLAAAAEHPGDAAAQEAARKALAQVAMQARVPAIFGNDLPPVHRPRLLPREPQTNNIVASFATPTLVDALPEDLAAGSEATLSPAVREKAASLDNDYVAIFDFVRSQIRTEWRAGSAQSVEETLRRGAGNDVEQASLLIALLRSSMAPARYVTGVVEVPVADLAAQIGVPATRVGAALAAAGMAHAPVLVGGQLGAFRIEHVWVSTRVPFANYRGSVADTGEPTWVPLMPALKPSTFQPGTPVLQALTFDTAAWIDTFIAAPAAGLPWDTLRARLASLLAAQTPPQSFAALAGALQLDAEPLGVLPASTPYRVLAVNAESADLIDEQRQWLQVRVRADDSDTAAIVLEQRIALAAMSSRRATLAYLPATVEDQNLANLRGGLGGFPAYLVRLRPTLLVDGRPAGAGAGTVDAGDANRLELTLVSPAGELTLQQGVLAGSFATLALDPNGGIVSAEPAANVAPDSDLIAGRILGRFAERYLQDWARSDDDSAAVFGQRLIRPLPSVALALPQYRAEGAFGLVDRLVFEGVALDAAAHPVEPISLRADDADETAWMRASALQGSALEAQLFEQLWAVDALSADRALRLANERNVPVLHLEPGDDTDDLAAHSATVREHVAQWLARGFNVDIPREPVTVQAWSGSGWRVWSADGGDSGYFLSGVYAGGVTVIPPGLWYFQDLAGALMDPYALESNDDPLAGFIVQIEADAQYQVARAGEMLEKPLRAFVTDRGGMPVRGASVRFVTRGGDAELQSGNESGASVIALTDNRGIASVTLRAPQHDDGLDGGFLLLDGDTQYSRAFTTAIDLVVATRDGPLTPGEPYFSYMVSGDAVRLELLPRLGDGTLQVAGLGFEGFVVHAYDAYDNEVANESISLSVADQYTGPGCASTATLPGSGVFIAGTCPGMLPVYAGNGCAPTSTSGITRYDGLYVNVVPSSVIQTQVTLTASAGAASVNHVMYTTGVIQVLDTGECYVRPSASGLQWTAGEEFEVARLGELIPFPRHFDYLASNGGIGTTGYSWFPMSPINTSLNITGGSASSLRTLGVGKLEFDITAGAQPSRISGSLFATLPFPGPDPEHFSSVNFGLLPAWAVDLPEPTLSPDFVELDPFQRSVADLVITAPILPPEYESAGITLEVVDDLGESVGGCYHDIGTAGVSCAIPRGTRFEPDRDYSARYTINSGYTVAIASDDAPVPFERGIVAGFGGIGTTDTPPDLDVFVDRKFPKLIEIQTEVDTQTGYICEAGARFIYALGQDATVDITFYELDEDGERADEAWHPVEGVARVEGVYTFDIAPDELSFGAYEYEIHATTADDEETHLGRFIHREKRRGSLPLSHSFVKGVDVYDGHAVVSAQDAAIGGRGPGLRFTRTYASHSGDDKTTLGRGWESDLESRVMRDSCGSVTVTGSSGQGQRYLPTGVDADGRGTYASPNGFHGTLLSLPAGGFDFYAKDGTLYHYAEPASDGTHLSWIEDPNGNRVTYEYGYSAGERVILRMTDAAGRALNFQYEVLTLTRRYSSTVDITETRLFLTALDGPAGLHVDYSYDPDGNLSQVKRSGAGGGEKIEAYTYEDKRGLWLQDPDGEFKYYHSGFRLMQASDAVTGGTREYTWTLGWIGVPLDNGSTLLIPEQRVASVEEPDHGVTDFVYSGLRGIGGTQTVTTDARSATTTYTMNQYGGADRVDAPPGTTVTVWNFVHLQPASVTDPLGTVTAYGYDVHGNKTAETVTHAHGTLTRAWTFAPPGSFAIPIKDRARTQTDARDIVTTFAYDARGNLTGAERGGITDSFGIDTNGDRTSHTDGAGDTTTYVFDAFGHQTEDRDALGLRHRATFDARDRMLSESDGNGAATTYAYDALDRRVRTTFPTTAAGSAERTVQYLDAQRKRIETDELHHATTFTQDFMGREIAVQNALGKTREMTYDRNGNLLADEDFRGNPTVYVYDTANRNTRKTEPENRVTVFTHDALGNVLTETVSRGGAADVRRHEYRYEHPLNLRTHERHLIDTGNWSETITAYDGNGNATSITDPNQHVTANTFDLRDRLAHVESPENVVADYGYDGADRRISESLNTSPAQVRAWAFDARGQQVSHVDGSGARWRTDYDLAGNVTRLTDPNNKAWNYVYDARNRRTGERGPVIGQIAAFEYDAVGNRILDATSDGRELQHSYDALNRRAASTDQLGAVESFAYDDDGNVRLRTDGEGRDTASTWNGLNQETARTLPTIRGVTRSLAWTHNVHNDATSETDANHNTTTHTYNGLGLRTASLLPGDATRQWTYDAARNMRSASDANGFVTQFDYDGLNRKTEQTDPTPPGTTQQWGYDAVGNVTLFVDRRGIPTSTRYDGENRTLETVRDGLRLSLNVYDGAGNLVRGTDANSEQTAFAYDGANRKLSEARPLQSVSRWTYTPWGDIETATDADGVITSVTYDVRQRPRTSTDGAAETTTSTYDGVGNRIAVTRPGPREWTYAYDAADRLEQVISPESAVTQYRYDAHGNRTDQRDAGTQSTTLQYDARHRVERIVHPGNAIETFAYDDEGNVVLHVDANGRSIVGVFDALNRITSRTYSAASGNDVASEAWTYDGNGNIETVIQSEAAGPQYTTLRTWDRQERLASETDRYGQRTDYAYDAIGNRIHRDDPSGTTTYQPDRLNRIVQVTPASASGIVLGYTSEGRVARLQQPNGAIDELEYDPAGRLAKVTHLQGSVTVASAEYRYDARGNRSSETQIDTAGTREITYGYDADDHLLSVASAAPDGNRTQSFTLDAVGNRLSERVTQGNAVTVDRSYHYGARQQLDRVDDAVTGLATTYTYDDNGALTSETTAGQTTAYRQNAQDRLATLTLPGAPPVDYSYDADGRRVLKQTVAEATRYGWDGMRLRRETNVTNNPLAAYEWSAGRILRSQRGAEISYAQHDALRSPVRWSRPDGGEQGSTRFDAWGNSAAQTGTVPPIGYTGHYKDAESGLYYAQQRYYAPALGRFTRIDPWEGDPGNPITLNKYLYGNGNPLIYVDPDGRIGFLTDLRDKFNESDAFLKSQAEESGNIGLVGFSLARAFMAVGSVIPRVTNLVSDGLAAALPGETFAGVSQDGRSELAKTVDPAVHAGTHPIQTGEAVYTKAVDTTSRAMAGERGAVSDLISFAGEVAVGAGMRKIAASSVAATSSAGATAAAAIEGRVALTVAEGADGSPALRAAAQVLPENQRPYSAQAWRAELEERYGSDNVSSTTVPLQSGSNVRLAGQAHPDSKVVFDSRGFPIFDDISAFDTRLPSDAFRAANYRGQMRMATRDLRSAIARGEIPASRFTPEQLRQIKGGIQSIRGYTWHHHQDMGRMQLVPRDQHKLTGHVGGEAMSQGQ